MDNKNRKSRTRRFRQWFKRKRKRADRFYLGEVTDWDEDEGEEYPDDSFVSRPENNDTCGLRVFVGTWNVAGRSPVGSLAVDVDEWLNLKEAADIYVLGFQEIVPLKARNVIGAEDETEATNWNLLIGKTLNNKYGGPWLTSISDPISSENYQYAGVSNSKRPAIFDSQTASLCCRYKLVASKKMVGVFITVWVKTELLRRYCISSVRVSSVACGIMGYLGNKGSVSVSMTIEGTSFCFIAAHLASGEKKGDEGRRNHQVAEIFRRTSFPQLPQDGSNPHPRTIFGHDQIFWFGDLNYRLYLEDNLARQLIQRKDWRALQEVDQLQWELKNGVFQGWREGNIEFAPTYKYSSSNCNRYSGGAPSRAGEKQRTPAWCDRILWYGKGVRQLSYFRSESKFSDHRPVSALFSTRIEVLKSRNPGATPPQSRSIPAITRQNQTGQGKAKEEATSILLSLRLKDIEALPSQMQ